MNGCFLTVNVVLNEVTKMANYCILEVYSSLQDNDPY